MKEKIKNPLLTTNKIIAVIFYIFMTLIGSGLVIILIGAIYSANHKIPFTELLNALGQTSIDKVPESIRKDYYIINAIGNMVAYLIMGVGVVFYMRSYLVSDTMEWKKKYRYFLFLLPASAAIFYGISYGVDYLIGLAVDSSNNQLMIESMIRNGGSFYMFIAVVICAPVVEELIYRKAIFSIFEKKPVIVSYIVSIVLFTIPHMLTTSFEKPGEWLLMCIPYMTSASLLCATYHLSGKNVYASWFVHLINNLVSFILLCL